METTSRLESQPIEEQYLGADVVLCYRNSTRDRINQLIRTMRGFGRRYPQAGEMVLCLRNAPMYNIYNGCVYRVVQRFNPSSRSIVIEIDDNEVEVPVAN